MEARQAREDKDYDIACGALARVSSLTSSSAASTQANFIKASKMLATESLRLSELSWSIARVSQHEVASNSPTADPDGAHGARLPGSPA